MHSLTFHFRVMLP